MTFEVIGDVTDIETLASGVSVRVRTRLNAQFGRRRWRKVKGNASVLLANGHVRLAELHWYESHGLGRRSMKIKRFLDEQ